jgi:SAM-dependent methyltransferase
MKLKNKNRFYKLSYFLRKLYSLKLLSFFLSENFLRKKIFKYIFLSGYWLDYNTNENQSRSGRGSNIDQSLYLKEELKLFFEKNNVKNILDIGCGDFKWMSSLLKEVDYDSYLGIDIVDKLIDNNIRNYETDKIQFLQKDIVNEEIATLKKFDFILVRHVFIHLKNSNINKVIDKIKKLDFKFFCVTSDPKILHNSDLKTEGRYRDVNLLISPFFLENCYKTIKVPVHTNENYVDLNIYDSSIKFN